MRELGAGRADVDVALLVEGEVGSAELADQAIDWPAPEEASHAVREYLAALDRQGGDPRGARGLLGAVRGCGRRLRWSVSQCGGAQGAEALSGLARAFFYVSHWSVDSAATAKLITSAVAALSATTPAAQRPCAAPCWP